MKDYFQRLIERVDASSEIQNDGKDKDGFYKPTRTLILRHLQLLKDLHDKPRAKPMLRDAWAEVVKTLPPEWLVMSDDEKAQMKSILN